MDATVFLGVRDLVVAAPGLESGPNRRLAPGVGDGFLRVGAMDLCEDHRGPGPWRRFVSVPASEGQEAPLEDGRWAQPNPVPGWKRAQAADCGRKDTCGRLGGGIDRGQGPQWVPADACGAQNEGLDDVRTGRKAVGQGEAGHFASAVALQVSGAHDHRGQRDGVRAARVICKAPGQRSVLCRSVQFVAAQIERAHQRAGTGVLPVADPAR